MKALMSWFGSWFLTMGAALLQLSGWIFDTFIQYIVISFGKTLGYLGLLDQNGQQGAITIGWTVFRDFSNILIIGFFVFIAISIILGLSEFGQKRLIANVLVVAVLMNFSLLFTKLIIDGSNFVAYQIYSQMASSNGTTSGQFNVSESFMRPMKITSVWYTYDLVREVATKSDSGFQAFAYGLIGGIMLTAVALVLFYGSFLIAWRGIIFILLMLTAPLAFATYLIPTLSKGEYGWNSWWKMLINNAAFGPLLMILLALSLAIINAAGSRATTPIGDIISDPSSAPTGAWITILVYIIGTGLLFASLKLASSFAGSIGGGYGAGWNLTKLLSLTPLAGVAAFAGAGMRRGFGGRAAFRSLELEEDIEKQRRSVRRAAPEDKYKENQKLMELLKQKGAADKTAKREFNFENTELGKALKKVGMPSLAGDTKGGFEGPRKKTAEEAAKATEAAVVSNKQAEQIAKEAMAQQVESQKKQLEEQRSTNEQVVKAVQTVADSAKRPHHAERDEAFKVAADATKRQSQAEEDFKAGKIDSNRREEVMREQKQRIEEANKKIQETNAKLTEIDKLHMEAPHVKLAQDGIRQAEQGLKELEKKQEEGAKELQAKIISESIDDAAKIASDLHHLDAYETKVTGSKIRDRLKDKRIKDQLRVMKTLDEGSGTPPAGGTA